jgi:hypothetical protein
MGWKAEVRCGRRQFRLTAAERPAGTWHWRIYEGDASIGMQSVAGWSGTLEGKSLQDSKAKLRNGCEHTSTAAPMRFDGWNPKSESALTLAPTQLRRSGPAETESHPSRTLQRSSMSAPRGGAHSNACNTAQCPECLPTCRTCRAN